MKAIENINGGLIVGCVLAYCLSSVIPPVHAIEGLRVSIDNTNAILTWPSTNTETFLLQYASNLDASTSWETLTDNYPASSSNTTSFVHVGSVTYPPFIIGGTNSGGSVSIDPTNTTSTNTTSTASTSDGTNAFQSTYGFYRVVRDGVNIYGLTNGAVMSGEKSFPIEFALNHTDAIVGVTFYDTNDYPIVGAVAKGTNNYWTLDWNTPMTPNGSYTYMHRLTLHQVRP